MQEMMAGVAKNKNAQALYQCVKTVTGCAVDGLNSKFALLSAAKKIYPTNTFTQDFDLSTSFFERRRLVAGAASGSAVVQISTSGNQGVMGATAAGATSSAQFAGAGSHAGAGASTTASSAGVGTAGAVGIAVGCTAIAALAVAFVVHQKQAARPVSNVNAGDAVAKAA